MPRSLLAFLTLLLLACDPDPKGAVPVDDSDAGNTDDAGTDADGDGYAVLQDCDDSDAAVNPGMTEVCGGGDEDCDGLTDGADDSVTGTSALYTDADGDGYGDPEAAVQTCAGPGAVEDSTDYDDTDSFVWLAPDTWVGYLFADFTGFCTGYGARNLDGDLDLGDATQADVDSLRCLTSVRGSLYSLDNAALTNVDSFSNLSVVDGMLVIHNNNSLTSIAGLSSLTTVSESLVISDNDVLTDVDGLSRLTAVGASLYIYDNDVITNVDSLTSLTSVGGDLDIGYNDALTDVDGLASLTSIGGYLSIYRNAALCESSVDALLLRLAGFGYAGATTISGNDSGC